MKFILALIISLFVSVQATSQVFNAVATFAGTSAAGLLNGPLLSAKFKKPYGICCDSTGAIYVADTYNHCIRKIENGLVTTIAGNGSIGDVDAQGTNARFQYPTGVFFKKGYLYISDNLNNKIKRMDAAGNVVTIAGSGAWSYADGPALSAAFKEPKSIIVDDSGYVYVADYENHCIRKIANGFVSTYAGIGGVSGDVLGPAATAKFYRPRDLCMDSAGNIYVVDLMNNKVKVISNAGIVSLVAGSGVNGNQDGTGIGASFSRPVGIDWFPNGDLCVLSSSSPKVRRVTTSGVATSVAGNGSTGYVNGPVASARFNLPQDICIDPNGNLYISDDQNNVIRILVNQLPPDFLGNDIVNCNNQPTILSVNYPGANFIWNDNSTNDSLIVSSTGIYWVDVIFNGDTTRDSINVTYVSFTASSQVISNNLCYGASTGSASVNASGGSGIFSYSWQPSGGNASTATGLPAGTWSCIVTDSTGCNIVVPITITQPPQLVPVQSVTGVSCFGGNDGNATISISGGTPGYSFNWLPSGGNDSSATGLSQGTYSVVISDSNNCSITVPVTITQPAAINAVSTITDPSCFGSTNGSASLTVTGGSPGYSFNWQPTGGNSNIASGLGSGGYTCIITDQNNCVSQELITINQPAQLIVTATNTNNSCAGDNNATATAIVNGGTGSYSFSWSPAGGITQTATGLVTGNYTVTVTDANGCNATQQVSITEPPPLVLVLNDDSVCAGSAAFIPSSVSGGTGAYNYTWSNGSVNPDLMITPGQSGTYSLVVTDANNCQINASCMIIVQPAPQASFSSNSTAGYFLPQTGSNLCFSNLSSGAVSWQWDFNGITTSNLQSPCFSVTPADTGLFCTQLTITGMNGCRDTSNLCIYIENLNYTIPNVFTPNGDGTNDVFTIKCEGIKDLDCSIYNRWGQLLYNWSGPSGYWDGKVGDDSMASDGTYFYVISMIDYTGKQYYKSGFFELIKNK